MEPLGPGDPRTAGPYRLTFRLGSGGMGRVFLGESPAGRRVAVKLVREDLASSPGFRDRFRREAKLAMRAGGFWAAQVVDADPDAAMPWIASQYVEGPSLAERVRLQGALNEREVRGLGLGLAEALASFHKGGLVHRDLKPSNVLLVDDGPRVIDFGISKALETLETSVGGDLTRTGTILGTPGFMSPEQALGKPAGPPSDVFSLGSLLVHASTGAGAFGDGPSHALLFRVVYEAPDLAGVPYGLRELVDCCLRKNPEERPAAGELVARFADGRQAAAPDPRTVAGAAAGSRTTAPENGTTGNGVTRDRPGNGVTAGDPRADAMAATGPQQAGSANAAATTGTRGASLPKAVAPEAGAPEAVPPEAVPPETVAPEAVLPEAVAHGAVAPGAAETGPSPAVPAASPSGERHGRPADLHAFAVEEEWGPGAVWRRMRRPVRRAAPFSVLFLLLGPTFQAVNSIAGYGLVFVLVYLLHHLRFALPLLQARTLRVEADGIHVRRGRRMLTVPWRDVSSVEFTKEKNRRGLALTAVLEKGAGTLLPRQLRSGDGVLRHRIVSSAPGETLTRAAGLETALRGFAGSRFRQNAPAAR